MTLRRNEQLVRELTAGVHEGGCQNLERLAQGAVPEHPKCVAQPQGSVARLPIGHGRKSSSDIAGISLQPSPMSWLQNGSQTSKRAF
jgi:hypothetical protein